MPLDLAIIGGGPAGAAAAFTAARRGLSVAIVERGEFPRDKVCGEFISPEALPLLSQMAPDLVAAAPSITRVEFIAPRGRPRGFPLPEPALGISRLGLDAALWQAAGAAGATLMPHTAAESVETAFTTFRLRLAGGNALDTRALDARALIVAAGRWFRLPGLVGDPAAGRTHPWLGVKARFRGLAPRAALELYCFPGGYCGLAPVENDWTNLCCLIHRDRAGALADSRDFAAWIAAAANHPALRDRLRAGVQVTPTLVTAPVLIGPRAPVNGRALFAGDAAGFIDPFTGDGIARALLSGALAVEQLADPAAYAATLARSARPAERASRRLRALVSAPGWLQSAAITALARPPFGPRLLAATRWRTL